jgi:dTMP kinase
MLSMQSGKLIVIDGGDGSGKGTQCALLVQKFVDAKLPVLYIDFPRYTTFFGNIVGSMMKGDFGSIDSISPYLASLPYASDRAQMKNELMQSLQDGIYIIANRYTTANMGHQLAKLHTKKEREHFIEWIQELEYTINGLPREDLVLYLHVDPIVAQSLIDNKEKRIYMDTKAKDAAEVNVEHQQHTEKAFLELVSRFNHWHCIECVQKGAIKSKEIIHNDIIQKIKKELKIVI